MQRYRESWYYFRADRPRRPHCIRWLEPGTRQVRSRSFPTRKKARDAKQAIDRQLNDPLYGQAPITWDHLIAEYGLTLARSSQAHRDETFRVLAYLKQISAPAAARDLTAALFDSYFARRAAGEPARVHGRKGKRQPTRRPPSKATLAKDYRVLHAFCSHCVSRGYLASNPLRSVNMPRPTQRIKTVPTDADWVRLLQVLPKKGLELDDPQAWHLLILLAVTTSLRQTDLLAITFDRIDFKASDDGVGLVRTHERKTDRESLHGLPPLVCSRVAHRWSDLPDGSCHLFPWRSFQRRPWERICAAASYRWTFHDLRAVAGTREAEADALRRAADHLGHSSPRVTKTHYLEMARVKVATARRVQLPQLPPLPAYPT